jgi:hypothetical protein
MWGEPRWWELIEWWEALLWWGLVVGVLIGVPVGITLLSSWWQNRQDTIVRGPYSPLVNKPRERKGFPGAPR